MKTVYFILFISTFLTSCFSNEKPKEEENIHSNKSSINDEARSDDLSNLSESLTFHASFDSTPDADIALGDSRIYSGKTVAGEQKPIASEPGIGNPPLEIIPEKGKFGSALNFTKDNSHVVFYKAEKNVSYSTSNFSGTMSLWLKLDPDKIPQTYTDPIQLTDKDYSNSAIWIDFTKNDKPSDFRLGIFGDQKVWDKKDLKGSSEEFFWRLLKIVKPPFSADKWTHVVVTWEDINTDKIARGKLYFDGELQGETGGIYEPFIWDLPEATIRLGTGPFIGMVDDIAMFDRSLSNEEVKVLFELDGGVSDLHPYIKNASDD